MFYNFACCLRRLPSLRLYVCVKRWVNVEFTDIRQTVVVGLVVLPSAE